MHCLKPISHRRDFMPAIDLSRSLKGSEIIDALFLAEKEHGNFTVKISPRVKVIGTSDLSKKRIETWHDVEIIITLPHSRIYNRKAHVAFSVVLDEEYKTVHFSVFRVESANKTFWAIFCPLLVCGVFPGLIWVCMVENYKTLDFDTPGFAEVKPFLHAIFGSLEQNALQGSSKEIPLLSSSGEKKESLFDESL